MRLVPKSLAGQLSLLLLPALALAQGVAFSLFARERIDALRHAYRDNAVPRTTTVVWPLADSPRSPHEAVIPVATSEPVRFFPTDEPVVTETCTTRRTAAISDRLAAAFGVGPGRVRVALLWIRFLDEDDPHEHHHDDEDDDRDEDRHDGGR